MVEDLLWLVREHLGEAAELLARDSAAARPRRGRRWGCCAAGSTRGEVARAVRLTAARGSCTPTTCSRRSAGARWRRRGGRARAWCCTCTSTGSCARSACASPAARECTRCHGRNTLPGVRLQLPRQPARGGRLRRRAGAVAAPPGGAGRRRDRRPERFARERLRELGAPLPWERVHVLAPPLRIRRPAQAPASRRAERRRGRPRPAAALRARRLAPGAREGGRRRDRRLPAGRRSPLVVAGEGPERAALRERARGGADVRFSGGSTTRELARAARGRGDRAGAVALGRDVRAGGRRGDGRRAARGRPAASARCPSCSRRTSSCRPATRARWPRRSTAWPGTGRPASAGCERVRALCAPERASARAVWRRDATSGARALAGAST